MSLCDTCHNPGACCRRFCPSFDVDAGAWREQAIQLFRDRYHVPFFHPVEAVTFRWTPPGQVAIRCNCERLDQNGRCSDYENRPPVCVAYEPGSDGLCVEFVGPPRDAGKTVAVVTP